MSKITDQRHLVTSQYKNAANLIKRSRLHERYSTNPVNWYTWVFDRLIIPANARLLDIGCGTGKLWLDNKDRIPPGWEFVFGDLSSGMVKEAQNNLAFLEARARFQVLDVQLLYFEPDHFDAIIANHMLYHVPNVRRALQEIQRILKPAGRFYAATNGSNHMQELISLIKSIPDIELLIPSDSLLMNLNYSFNLENGVELLEEHFSEVLLHRYDDTLKITEVEPLVDYILSIEPEAVTDTQTQVLISIHDHIINSLTAGGGVINISKSTGLFESIK